MITVTITEPTEYTDRSFQTALWWERVTLDPGTYEVVPWSNIPYYYHFKVPATVVEDYFAANFAGASVQPYNKTKNAGNRTNKWIGFPPGYQHDSRKAIAQYETQNPTFRITWDATEVTPFNQP